MKGFKELSLVALSLVAHTVSSEKVQDHTDHGTQGGQTPIGDTMKDAIKTSDVHILSEANFTSFITDHPHVLAEFYAPWCGHCQALEPKYEKAATELKDSRDDVFLAKVDCTENKQLCEDQGVQGFPTLKAFKGNTDTSKMYAGARETEALVEWMVKQTQPVVTIMDKDHVHDDFTKSHKVVVVGYLDEKDTKSLETFDKAAEQLSDLYIFARTSHPNHADGAGVKFPSVVLYKQYDDPKTSIRS